MTKQATTLTDKQVATARRYTANNPRHAAMLELSLSAGLRAHEIAGLDWTAVDVATGTLRLTHTKGDTFRAVPISAALRAALTSYGVKASGPVFPSRRDETQATDANAVTVWFHRLFADLGFKGASSHSGRRTFVTNAARKVSMAGGSLRDVQALAGHADLRTTALYIDTDGDAQRRLVDML